MAVILTLDALTKYPYNDPHYTRDELIFYVLPDSFVLPIAAHAETDVHVRFGNIFVTIGGLSLKKTKSPWKTSGKYVYLIGHALSNTLSADVGISDSIKKFFSENVYVTSRLHFIQFENRIQEDEHTVIGFIVKSKYLKITTQQNEINLDISPAKNGDLPI